MQQFLRTSLEETSARDILERILDGCIAFDQVTRFLLSITDFSGDGIRVVLAPERRRKPFTLPGVASVKTS